MGKHRRRVPIAPPIPREGDAATPTAAIPGDEAGDGRAQGTGDMANRRGIGLLAGAAAVLGAAMVPPAVPGFVAAAQTHGDEKCSPGGHVLRYTNLPTLGIREWRDTFARCDPRNGNSSNANEEDRPSRRSSGGGESSGGRPEDGDEKCGPDGYILRYDWNDYLQKGAWRSTFRRCSR